MSKKSGAKVCSDEEELILRDLYENAPCGYISVSRREEIVHKPDLAGYFNYTLYAISDSIPQLSAALAAGASLIQLRDKKSPLSEIKQKSRELAKLKNGRDFLFIINDYPEIAAECGADGVHLGQDYPLETARKIIGPDLIIGQSTHALAEATSAQKEGADYISAGPIFATPTKANRSAVGINYLKEALTSITIPIVAIGGIDLTNLDTVLEAGAKTIGVVRAAANTAQLLAKIKTKKQK